mmetsp:Transcript_15308/g.49766  ORF Transcript_15308/g.49766 Transcript_15308/m.49766 type:complete len:366 (-) Transcript_15308:20-1117(-)
MCLASCSTSSWSPAPTRSSASCASCPARAAACSSTASRWRTWAAPSTPSNATTRSSRSSPGTRATKTTRRRRRRRRAPRRRRARHGRLVLQLGHELHHRGGGQEAQRLRDVRAHGRGLALRHHRRLFEEHGQVRRLLRGEDPRRPEARGRLQRLRLLPGQQRHPRLHHQVQRPAGEELHVHLRHQRGRRRVPAVLARDPRRRPDGLQGPRGGPRRPRLQQARPGHPLPGELLPRPRQDVRRVLPQELAARALERRGRGQRDLRRQLGEDGQLHLGRGHARHGRLAAPGRAVGRHGPQGPVEDRAADERDGLVHEGQFRAQDRRRGGQEPLRVLRRRAHPHDRRPAHGLAREVLRLSEPPRGARHF